MRRVLVIDGGGIKGVFPAAFLSTIEDSIQSPVRDYFDLIVGTSTGGILALGLGLSHSAQEILKMYVEDGPKIFGGSRLLGWVRSWIAARYNSEPLKAVLSGVFRERCLGESLNRLVIPSLNLETGEVHVWKTAHHTRFERDYKATAVDVAMATSAAPTYFPAFRSASGLPLVDGGMWANNPVLVAVVEALAVLGWPSQDLRILSLGCTTTALDIRLARRLALGKLYWANKVADAFMQGQSSSALGMARLLLDYHNKDNIIRISPLVSAKFSLDKTSEIDSLRGLGDSEARKALPSLRKTFFDHPKAEAFVPIYNP